MNTAMRLVNLLSKVQSSRHNKVYDCYSEIFDAEGCFEVVSKLLYCNSEIDRLERELPKNQHSRALVSNLRLVVNCRNLEATISKNVIPQTIIALNAAGAYMENDMLKFENDEIMKLADDIILLQSKVEQTSLSGEHKEIILQYLQEILDGLNIIEYCGTKAFAAQLVKASGKLLIYNKVFADSGLIGEMFVIINRATKILGDISTWYGAYAIGSEIIKAVRM